MKTILFCLGICCAASNILAQQTWLIKGNSGLTSSNFLGSTDAKDLIFRTNNIERGRLLSTGEWRFGTATNFARINAGGQLSFGGTGSYQVAGNRYVFQYGANNNYGLFFNSTAMQYEFRNGFAQPVFFVNANSGNANFTGNIQVGSFKAGIVGPDYSIFDENGNLSFGGKAAHLVGDNQFALLCNGEPGDGLYMNGDLDQWEFKDKLSTAYFTINEQTHLVSSTGGFHAGKGNDNASIDGSGNLSFAGKAAHLVNDNQFALLCNGEPGDGLYMNGDLDQWEFTDVESTPYFTINEKTHLASSSGGFHGGNASDYASIDAFGNLSFAGKATYLFDENKYVLLCNGQPKEGLYMNGDKDQWEFRDENAVPYVTLNNGSYDLAVKGGVKVGFSNTAVSGNIRFTGNGFQGFDGTSWKTFLTTDAPQSAVVANANNQDMQTQIQSLQKEVADLKAVVASLLKANAVENMAGAKSLNVTLSSGALLEQNSPNPFSNTTTINYYLPVNKGNSYINFYSSAGVVLKSVKLSAAGKGTINVKANELPSGTYQYSLMIDGKIIDTKQMILAK